MLTATLEKEFWREIGRQAPGLMKIVSIFAIVMICLGTYADITVLASDKLAFGLLLRLLSILYMTAGFILSVFFSDFIERHYKLCFALMFYAIVIPVTIIGAWVGSIEKFYFMGLFEIEFGIVTFFTLPKRSVIWGIVINNLLYALSIPFLAGGPLGLQFQNLIIGQIIFALIAILAHHILLGYKKDNFRQRRELERAYDKLSELDRAKSDFVANISHEVRTPLTLILTPLESLLEKGRDSLLTVRRELLTGMRNNARLLLELINSLLDMARLEAGKMELRPEIVNLPELIRNLLSHFESTAKTRGLELNFESGDGAPHAAVDREKLEKILFNLMSNSLKFTEKGSINVTLTADDDDIRIAVHDTGIGIAAEEREAVFERFHQGEEGPTRRYGGSGIGLYLVRRLAELHGGHVGLESEPGKGSRFTVVLPRNLSPAADEPGREREIPGRSGVNIIQETAVPIDFAESGHDAGDGGHDLINGGHDLVLVVEDHDEMREYLSGLLAGQFRVQAVTGSLEALAAVGERLPDLVLSDVMMPEMDGIELLRCFRDNPRLRPIPFLLLTAKADVSDRISGLGHGADDYIAKPFHAAELLARLRRALERSRSRELAIARARERIYADLHDNLGARLTDLMHGLHELRPAAPVDPELLTRIRKNSERTVRTFRDSLSILDDFRMLQDDFLDGLNMILLRRYTGQERPLIFRYDEELARRLTGESVGGRLENLYAIFQELSTNDLKYGGGVSTWSFRTVDGALVVEMEAATFYEEATSERTTGRGSANIQNRLAEMGGSIRSSIESGLFRASIRLPL